MKSKGEILHIKDYPYYEKDINGNIIYFEQLIHWTSIGIDSFIFNETPLRQWIKRIYNDKSELIEHEDSIGNYWSKIITPEVSYPYLYPINIKFNNG